MQIYNTGDLGCRWAGGQIHIKQQRIYQTETHPGLLFPVVSVV